MLKENILLKSFTRNKMTRRFCSAKYVKPMASSHAIDSLHVFSFLSCGNLLATAVVPVLIRQR